LHKKLRLKCPISRLYILFAFVLLLYEEKHQKWD
jgi:hypothetical protein